MRLICDPAEWTGALPALLVAPAEGPEIRRGLLRSLVARILGIAPEQVVVLHAEGRAPRLVRPADGGLHLSSASRRGIAALAVGRGPVGVDIELVEPSTEPAWNVLHPDERSWLSGLPSGEQAPGFVRLWAAKEAYLKALGTGLSREPSGFAVLALGESGGGLRVLDPASSGAPAVIATAWTTHAGRDFSVALAELPDGR